MTKTPLFDTHCHLDFPVFDPLRTEVLDACRQRGVERILVPGVTAAAWDRILALCGQHQALLPALGLHPCFLDQHRDTDIERLARRLGRAVALGEIGLDRWSGDATLETQVRLFEQQLDLAEQFALPILLHVRKAHDQVLMRLRRRPALHGGIVHAFSGSRQQAEQYMERGFCLGIGGAITYPRASRLARTLMALPVEALVLETDAPDMPLCGYQGQVNRPDRLPQVLAALAAVRGESAQRLARQLWLNSCRVLNLPHDRSA